MENVNINKKVAHLKSKKRYMRKRKELREIEYKNVWCYGKISDISYKRFNTNKFTMGIERPIIGIYACIKNCTIENFGTIDHTWIELPLESENEIDFGKSILFYGKVVGYRKGDRPKKYPIQYGINDISFYYIFG